MGQSSVCPVLCGFLDINSDIQHTSKGTNPLRGSSREVTLFLPSDLRRIFSEMTIYGSF